MPRFGAVHLYEWGTLNTVPLFAALPNSVEVVLLPEGPERGDLAPDFAAALSGDDGAAAFFDTLAQFYRNAYLRYIDGTNGAPKDASAASVKLSRCSRRG